MLKPSRLKFLLALVALIAVSFATFGLWSQVHATVPPPYNYPKASWWKNASGNYNDCDAYHFGLSGQTAHLLKTWNGLEVCGYGPTQGGTDVSVTFPGGSSENEWECTELVKRYLYLAYGAPALSNTNGNQIVDTYTGNRTGYNGYPDLFTRVTNDGTTHIKVGDVLSYYSPDNHTGIVSDISGLDGTGTGTITVIEQNTPGSQTTGQHTQSVSNWVIQNGVDDSSTNGNTVQYWLTPNLTYSWSNTSPSGTTNDQITSMASTTPYNVWATGWEQPSGSSKQPVAYLYNGTSWTKYKPTAPCGMYNNQYLEGIATDSASDAWAVGYGACSNTITLAYQWNGSSWSQKTSDNPSSSANYLNDVAIDSSGGVWAVGFYYDGSHYQPLIEKWNGTKLAQQTNIASLPSGCYIQGNTGLGGIALTSSTSGWAVGKVACTSGGTTTIYDVIYQYDGTTWTPIDPRVSGYVASANLHKVRVVGITNDGEAWMIGEQQCTPNCKPLILHYTTTNGWQEDTSYSSYYPAYAILYGIGASSQSNVWIVGYWYSTNYVPYTMHYNGYAWVQVNTPTISGAANLEGVTVPSNQAFAGGSYSAPDAGTGTPLTFQYS